MSKTHEINGQQLAVWPDDLEVFQLSESIPVFHTQFHDMEQYHAPLINRILELEQDKTFTHRMKIGGSKVRDVHRWGIPEADFIHARALEMFARGVDKDPSDIKVDVCWASVSRKHEYLTIHGHYDCLGAVVYMLTPGDIDENNEFSGRFAIVDPRVPECCPQRESCPTRELSPDDMQAGSMVMFPADLGHFVHPYTGDAPRITIAWNLYF